MKRFIDIPALEAEINELQTQRADLQRQRETLRVQVWRLKNLLKSAKKAQED